MSQPRLSFTAQRALVPFQEHEVVTFDLLARVTGVSLPLAKSGLRRLAALQLVQPRRPADAPNDIEYLLTTAGRAALRKLTGTAPRPGPFPRRPAPETQATESVGAFTSRGGDEFGYPCMGAWAAVVKPSEEEAGYAHRLDIYRRAKDAPSLVLVASLLVPDLPTAQVVAVGLLPLYGWSLEPSKPQPKPPATSERILLGACTYCGTPRTVTLQGVLRLHKVRGHPCPGGGHPPKPTPSP